MSVQRFREFRMPDVGEGLDEAEILKWYVGAGDPVHDGMLVCEVETAKAVVELPIPYDGSVHRLHFDEAAVVPVGEVIITVDTRPGDGPPEAAGEAGEPRQAVLVGYGVLNGSGRRRPRKSDAAALGSPDRSRDRHRPTGAVPAKPPVRKLAKDLGVDLGRVPPTGPGGTVTREDVRAAVAVPEAEAAPRTEHPGERRIPVQGVRRATAKAVVASAFTAPHVTEFLDVDVTRTVKLVRELRQDPEFEGRRVTPLLLVARALLTAVRRHPEINAGWDEPRQEIVLKEAVNLGIAAATPRGLLVPNIKRAERLTLPELADAIGALTETARAGRTGAAELSGGTVTITNIGVFGVDTGTPILNPGEAAILAVGAIRERPWVHRGRVVPRQVASLALSFDHRLVDGELGSRVLADIGAVLERPKRLITWS